MWDNNHLSFDTEEGIRRIEEICSCELPPVDSKVHDLVKKCQTHHHANTFIFPRQECKEFRIVPHSFDECIRNDGRTCLLKRLKEDDG